MPNNPRKPKSNVTTNNKNNNNANANPKAPDIWKEAYKALRHDDHGATRLHKLNQKIKQQIGLPDLNLRSPDGYKRLRALIEAKSVELTRKNAASKVAAVSANMLRLKDLVGAAAGAGGPYVGIPVAALFMVFSMEEIYRQERDVMFRLAENITHYTVLAAKCHERIRITSSDDDDMQKLKQTLRIVCIGLYKDILFSCAELADFFYSEWKRTRLVLRTHDWKLQLEDLTRHFELYVHYRDEMDARPAVVAVVAPMPVSAAVVAFTPKKNAKKAMGPGPRNPLHWAVALSVPERVNELVSSQEYPINALTPKSWTAAHLAARNCSTGIMRTLLTSPGINLSLPEAEHGRTALHIAALHNKVGNVKLLLDRNARILGLRDAKGRTAFLLAAQKGFVNVMQVLKDKGQDVNEATGKSAWTGLHFAAENGHVAGVKWLLANGAKKDAKSKVGKGMTSLTAKQAAEKKGKVEVVRLL